MKAIVKNKEEKGLWLVDIPKPQCGRGEVLIKVRKTSICGTDLNIYNWGDWAQKTVPVPLTVGHEFAGVVEEVGGGVTKVQVGQRVSGEGHLVCGVCPNCRVGKKHLCFKTEGVGYHVDGCFAEYLVLPEENVFQLPETVSDDIAAIFDPYGNAMHTALSFPLTGEDVLITGAGPIGIMAAAIAKKAGARSIVITDKQEKRLALAKQMGATKTINVMNESVDDAIDSLRIEGGFTVGMEMSGSPHAMRTLLEKMRHGGNVCLLGILPPDTMIDWDLVIFKMLVLKGIYGREIFSTWYQMVHLLESGLDLEPIITHRFHYTEFEKGFAEMFSGTCGKVILDWENS